MNKTLFNLTIACTLSWMGAHAQPIMSYDLESKVGTYQEITDGTIIKSCTDSIGEAFNNLAFWPEETSETKVGAGIPIGFDFTFNDTQMNRFVIGSNPFIALGKDEINMDPSASFVSMAEGSNLIGCVARYEPLGLAGTEISYKLEGTSPNRVLIIQYKNLGIINSRDDLFGKIQLQFRLYETSNKIQFIYKNWKPVQDVNSTFFRAGIKGTLPGDGLFASDSWSNPTSANKASNIDYTLESYPVDGLTHTFTPAANCMTPTDQPTGLSLTPTSIGLSGEFTATTNADHYLTVISEEETLTASPVDGTIYNVNDKLGNGTVIGYSTETTFTTPEDMVLNGAKKYYVHIFSVNAFCSYGPKYNTSNPLTGNVTTMPTAPQAMEIKEEGWHEVSLEVTPNEANDNFIVAMTTEYATDRNNNILIDGKFGQPTKDLQVGDAIEGGGVVIYKGSENTIKKSELEINTLYHFKAWSIDSQGNVSTTGTTANTLTWGEVPFTPNFEQYPSGPFGWTKEGDDFRTSLNRTDQTYTLQCRLQANAAGTINALTTPWVLLKEGTNRVLIDYNMNIYSGYGGGIAAPYNDWGEEDLFAIVVTKDELKFDTIYSATAKTAMKQEGTDTYNSIYAAFDKYAGEKVKVKIYWKCYQRVTLTISHFEIEEKLPCDYPINVTASSLCADQASIGWTCQGEETAWDIRYRIATGTDGVEQKWSTPLAVESNPYLLTGLPTQKNIELQVRAKCSLSSQSNWSKSLLFTSGYGIPFTEEFKENALPAGWEFKTGAIADPTEFCEGSSCRPQWKWNTNRPKGLFLSPAGTVADEWLLMPIIDLEDGSANYTLNFDVMMATVGTATDEEYKVVVSTDGGATFSSKNVIATFAKSELPEAYQTKTFTASLKGYKGKIRPALYVKTADGQASYVQMVKVSVEATCPSDIADVAVSDITAESAKITWTSEAEECYVFIRKAGETTKNYEKLTAKEKAFDGLEARTAYEIGITKMCAIDDTAKVTLAKFTTLALAPCAQVTAVTTTPSQYKVVIAWEGEAMKYNVRYRAAGTDEWTIKSNTENTITIEGLEADKDYEYGIQSVCSDAEGDISEYTETASFKTLAVTCFPPTNIQSSVTHKSATITWEGEADNYELGYRKGTEEWIVIEATGKTKELTGLDAETTYSVRLRSKCSADDISLWSETVEFTTLPIPQCVTPTNLIVTSLTATSAKLSWDADESNLTWDIHYRASSSTTWIDEKGLTDKTYDLTGLSESTAYLWAVKATCDEGRTSAWSTQNKFTTEASSIDEMIIDALNVYVSGNVLNVINGEHGWIENIQVYSLNGQMLSTYTIDSDENVLIPMNLKHTKVLVKINGTSWTKTYSVLF